MPLTKPSKDDREPVLVLMHLLGSSKREWDQCASSLGRRYRCVGVDLAGFGDAAHRDGFSVEEMACSIETVVRSLQPHPVILVGHSMSGKVALVVAARKLVSIAALILIAPSPPSPEPMKEESRQEMLAMKRDRESAARFLDAITAHPLSGEFRERAIDDFIRCAPEAWKAWLNEGSREDWTERVWIVPCPSLVIAGGKDRSLSASVQEQTTMRHLAQGRLAVIQNSGHVPTMETPAELSVLMTDFIESHFPSR